MPSDEQFLFALGANAVRYHDFQLRKQPNSRHAPYFAEFLYVYVRPETLHVYLDRLITLPEKANYAAEANRLVARYVLIFRSESHLNDLWRQILLETDESNQTIHFKEPGEYELAYRLHVYMQVVIEHWQELRNVPIIPSNSIVVT